MLRLLRDTVAFVLVDLYHTHTHTIGVIGLTEFVRRVRPAGIPHTRSVLYVAIVECVYTFYRFACQRAHCSRNPPTMQTSARSLWTQTKSDNLCDWDATRRA